MKRKLYAAVPPLVAAGLLLAGCDQPNPPSTLAASLHVVTDQGWTGRRYMDNQFVLAEEFDTNHDGRLDLWRFYSRGHLVSEERDLHGAGRIGYLAAWDGASRRLISAARDADGRGVFDLQVEAVGVPSGQRPVRWRVAEDRHRRGYADLLLTVEGPPDLFHALGIDLATVQDISLAIPAAHWRERRVDTRGDGTLGALVRYQDGKPVAYAAVLDASGKPSQWTPVPPGVDPQDAPLPISPEAWREQAAAARAKPPKADTAPTQGLNDGAERADIADSGRGPRPGRADRQPRAAPVPSTAVERAIQRRNQGAGAGETSTAGLYPDRMLIREAVIY